MEGQDKGSTTLEVLKVVLLPIAIAIVGGVFSWIQHRSALEKQYLDRVAFLLEDLASENPAKQALAVTYMHALAREEKINQDFADDLARVALEAALGKLDERELQSPEVARAVEKSFESVRNQVVDELPTRVFLHIADESQREPARALQEFLQANGYLVPGIELVESTPRENQLRFLRESDKAEAKEIQGLLADNNYKADVVDLSHRYEGTVNPKTFEVWLAARENG